MPVSWELFGAYVFFESDEAGTIDELRRALREATLDAAWVPGLNVVHDQRRVLRVFQSSEVAARITFVRDAAKELGIRRWAVVVKDGAAYGMARMAEGRLQSFSEVKFAVFKELADARGWASVTWDRG